MLYDIVIELVNSSGFVKDVIGICMAFQLDDFSEEFEFELIDKSEILYDFYNSY